MALANYQQEQWEVVSVGDLAAQEAQVAPTRDLSVIPPETEPIDVNAPEVVAFNQMIESGMTPDEAAGELLRLGSGAVELSQRLPGEIQSLRPPRPIQKKSQSWEVAGEQDLETFLTNKAMAPQQAFDRLQMTAGAPETGGEWEVTGSYDLKEGSQELPTEWFKFRRKQVLGQVGGVLKDAYEKYVKPMYETPIHAAAGIAAFPFASVMKASEIIDTLYKGGSGAELKKKIEDIDKAFSLPMGMTPTTEKILSTAFYPLSIPGKVVGAAGKAVGGEKGEIIGQVGGDLLLFGLPFGTRYVKVKVGRLGEYATKTVREVEVPGFKEYVDPKAMRELFTTPEGRQYETMSPETAEMVKDLGLTGKQYRRAVKEGITIMADPQTVKIWGDRPWFKALKDHFGIISEEPTMPTPGEKTFIFGQDGVAEPPPAGPKPPPGPTPSGLSEGSGLREFTVPDKVLDSIRDREMALKLQGHLASKGLFDPALDAIVAQFTPGFKGPFPIVPQGPPPLAPLVQDFRNHILANGTIGDAYYAKKAALASHPGMTEDQLNRIIIEAHGKRPIVRTVAGPGTVETIPAPLPAPAEVVPPPQPEAVPGTSSPVPSPFQPEPGAVSTTGFHVGLRGEIDTNRPLFVWLNKESAEGMNRGVSGGKAAITEIGLNFKNPLIVEPKQSEYGVPQVDSAYIAQAKREGYDSVIFLNKDHPYAAILNPSQLEKPGAVSNKEKAVEPEKASKVAYNESGKEPWEMSLAEYNIAVWNEKIDEKLIGRTGRWLSDLGKNVQNSGRNLPENLKIAEKEFDEAVEQHYVAHVTRAIAEGKPVPQFVKEGLDQLFKEEPKPIKKEPPREAEPVVLKESDFLTKWDSMGYGERQDIANKSIYGTMRKVVHRLSGSKWSEISSGEREELIKAAGIGVGKRVLSNEELTRKNFKEGDTVYFKEGWDKSANVIHAIDENGNIIISGSPLLRSPTEFTKEAPKEKQVQTETHGDVEFEFRPLIKKPTPQLSEVKSTPSSSVADWVQSTLESGKPFTKQELFDQADTAFGGTMAEGKYNGKDAFDALEMGINHYIADSVSTMSAFDPRLDMKYAREQIDLIRERILDKVPSQSGLRSAEQDEFQQFSTPPDLAYTMAWAANLNKADVVLEPSAGIGGIASFAKNAGAQTIVNELSKRRSEILKKMGFDRVFTENAEQLNNILPADIKPTVVLMNPPFSATAGRIQGQRSSSNVVTHLDQAFKRIQPGGRMVALIGKGWFADPKAVTDYLANIVDNFNLRANIIVSGKGYSKYGTTYDNRILVFDKTAPDGKPTVKGQVEDVKDAIPLLQEVRNARTALSEQPANQPSGEKGLIAGESQPGPGRPVPSPTGEVRPGKREGEVGGEGTRPVNVQGVSGQPGGMVPEKGVKTSGGPGRPGTSKKPEPSQPGAVLPGSTGPKTVSQKPELPEVKPSELKVESKKVEKQEGELTDSVYESYRPKKLRVEGAKAHPAKLVESAAMSVVDPPSPTYQPNLPKNIITSGKLSDVQVEAVVYAGQSHEEILPSGERRAFMIGDGTGVGKGREISAILLDNWNQGRRKAIWVSKDKSLFHDAQRDVKGIGWNEKLLFEHGKIKADAEIKASQGVLYTTYDTIKSGANKKKEGKIEKSRLDQIVEWLGENFDGVIAFDESHNMGNAIAVKGERGTSQPSQRALSGIDLQNKLPNARIVYVSATGATEVINLAYAPRLGLWGKGTPFATVEQFISQVKSGGLASMELVARDMKAMGAYMSRKLSFDDVTYDKIEHTLTPEQRIIYDDLATAWQGVLKNVRDALAVTDADKNSRRKSAALSAFWGSHQRFFNQVLTSMQMPSAIADMQSQIAKDNSVIIQLVNTNEANQERQLSRMEEGDDLEDLDLTPRDQLMEYIKNSFPVQQYEEYTDENGNVRSRPVYDSHNNPVENSEAVAMREALLDKIGAIKVPDGPLELILDAFGVKDTAEVTGRRRRVVRVIKNGEEKMVIEPRSRAKADADADAFMADKKKVLIFSDAGGTGRSYHADLTARNQRKRVHYLVQPGWRADRAVQGFGRSHRSNQKQAPHYNLVTTDIKGQKRFISSIARRLDQLGALTGGQRQTGSGGIFQARDNLESQYASDALVQFFTDLARNRSIGDLDLQDFQDQTGLRIVDEYGQLLRDLPPIRQFLNRLLSMNIDTQNDVFEAFSERLDSIIEREAQAGTLDVGLETLKADRIDKVHEDIIYTDPKSGAETKYVEIATTHKTPIFDYKKASDWDNTGFWQNIKSGKIWVSSTLRTKTDKYGNVNDYHTLRSVGYTQQTISPEILKDEELWKKLSPAESKQLWNEEIKTTSPTYTKTEHIISGAILPVWDRLETSNKVYRLQTSDGERILGMVIDPKAIKTVLKNFGASARAIDYKIEDVPKMILTQNYGVYLANGWRIKRSKVSGDNRIEIVGPSYYDMDELKDYGVFTERVNYETRFFVPTDESGVETLKSIVQYKPISEILPPTVTDKSAAAASVSQAIEKAKELDGERVAKTERTAPKKEIKEKEVARGTYFSWMKTPSGSKFVAQPTGKKVDVLEGFEFFIYKDSNADIERRWSVVEATTGLAAAWSGTRESAIDAAKTTLNKEGITALLTRKVNEAIEKDTVTPWYKANHPEQYSLRNGPPDKPTLEAAKEIFKGQEVYQSPDGNIIVKTRGGQYLEIKEVESITPNDLALKIAYGRTLKGRERIVGKYHEDRIELVKGRANQWLLSHEVQHWLEDAEILTSTDVAALRGHIKRQIKEGNFKTRNAEDPGGSEDRANFIADELNAPKAKGAIKRIIDRIRDFIDKIVNLFGKRTARGVVSDIKTGRVFNKAASGERGIEGQPMFAKEEKPDIVPPMTSKKGPGETPPKDASMPEGGKIPAQMSLEEFGKYLHDQSYETIMEPTAPGHGPSPVTYLRKQIGDEGVFFRKGPLPKGGQSYNFAEGRYEKGVSVYPTPKATSFAGLSEGSWYYGKGKMIDTGSDSEPIIAPIGEWKKIGDNEYSALRNYHKIIKKESLPNLSTPPGEGGEVKPPQYSIEEPDLPKGLEAFLKDLDEGKVIDEKATADMFQELAKDEKVLKTAGLDRKQISLLRTMMDIPHWISKDYPEIKTFLRREVKRQGDREQLIHEFMASPTKKRAGEIHEYIDLPNKKAEELFQKAIIPSDAQNRIMPKAELEKMGFDEPQIVAYYAYKRSMDKAWNRIVSNAQDMILKPFRDQPWFDLLKDVATEKISLDDALSTLKTKEEKDAFTSAVQKTEAPQSRLKEIRSEIKKVKFYSPRVREQGEYVVRVYNEAGKVIHSERTKESIFQTRESREADRIVERLQKQYPGLDVDKKFEQKTSEEVYQRLSDAAIERFVMKAKERVKTTGDVGFKEIDAVTEAFLEAIADELKSRGFGRHAIHRVGGKKNVIAGYKTTGGKDIFYNYITGMAGIITKQDAAFDFYQELSNLNKMNIPNRNYNYAAQYVEDMLRNTGKLDMIGGKLRALAFSWYLMGNMKSAAVQFSQNYVTGIPILAGDMNNLTKAAYTYQKAMKDVARGKMTAEEKKALTILIDRGVTTDQYIREIKGRMMNRLGSNYYKMLDILSLPFSGMEIFNRKSAALAMLRWAKKNGATFDEALEKAEEFVYDTHYLMGKANLPEWARGGTAANMLARTGYTFRSFNHNYVLSMVNAFRAAGLKTGAKVFGASMAFLMAFGGVLALPFLDDILDILERTTGEPHRARLRNLLRRAGGPFLERLGLAGIPGLLGVDISGSLKIGIPFIGTGSNEFFGVFGGLFQKGVRAFEAFDNQEYLRALESGSPMMIENVLKAERMAKGATTPRGKTMFTSEGEPIKLTAPEAGGQLFGFRPARVAIESMVRRSYNNIRGRYKKKKDHIYELERIANVGEEELVVPPWIERKIDRFNNEAKKINERAGTIVIPYITTETLDRAVKSAPDEKFIGFAAQQ